MVKQAQAEATVTQAARDAARQSTAARTWRSRYASGGMELEARAMIGRETATIRGRGESADALAVWMRLADVAGQMRDTPPVLLAAAALAGLAAGIRTQGFFEVLSEPDPAP